MRRILQSSGAEVIHLGHNRSVADIVNTALQEDVQGIAISSYQGGHVEYLKYMVDMLKQNGGATIRIFAGGGGVIIPQEIQELEAYGVTKVYSPQDGQSMGLKGMIQDVLSYCDFDPGEFANTKFSDLKSGNRRTLSQLITTLENGNTDVDLKARIQSNVEKDSGSTPVMGITGTGGSGKSSLTDELIRRFRMGQQDNLKIAIIAIDPTRRKTGGALLGDRIRMNSIESPNIYFRSIATRDASGEIPDYLSDIIAACTVSGFDLIMVETPGIGQGDAGIVPLVNCSLYVMTPEFGAQSQLEKIDMLDYADFVAINKFDRKGAEDAQRDVAKQFQRNHEAFSSTVEDMPVYGTTASRFNDDGVTALYHAILGKLNELGMQIQDDALVRTNIKKSSANVPPERTHYLAQIAETVREYKKTSLEQANIARERQQLSESKRLLGDANSNSEELDKLIAKRDKALQPQARKLIEKWTQLKQSYAGENFVVKIRDKEIQTQLTRTTLSGITIPRIVLPSYKDHGEQLKWLLLENVPGSFPYTAGVFAFKREGEDPTRMFAGEGDAFRTNRRFKQLSEQSEAKRLSTAFDSVTLYGCDPDERPDIYGKVGNAGVSIATLDDMRVLYDGFDLCNPTTSVSMTINGPAPTILAMFLNTAIEQQLKKFETENSRQPSAKEITKISSWALQNLRGTVQADILKEDQGQNTCIFSTEFSLKMMGDIQQYFIDKQIHKFCSDQHPRA